MTNISYRHQAEAVEVTWMEYRDHVQRLEQLPIGKGGIDPAAIKLKRMRLEVLEAAARSLYRAAEKAEERRIAEHGCTAE